MATQTRLTKLQVKVKLSNGASNPKGPFNRTKEKADMVGCGGFFNDCNRFHISPANPSGSHGTSGKLYRITPK